jgi:hypothetical protein
MNFKGLTLIVFILILIISCEDKDWDNPYDEESSTNLDWAPFISNIEQEDESVVLEFGCNEINFDSYVIERSIDNGSFSKVASPAKTATEWVDNNITKGGKLHKYKIYAKAGNNKSNSDEAEITPYLAPKFTVNIDDITYNSFSYEIIISDNGGANLKSYDCLIGTEPSSLSTKISETISNYTITGTYDELNDTTTYFIRFRVNNTKYKTRESDIIEITTKRIVYVYWEDNLQLGSQYSTDFYTIHEYENLTISDNVEVTNIGTSEVIIKVAKTLTLGKNVVIRVRNGFYEKSPENKPDNFTYSGNANDVLFPKTYGKGGNGGEGIGNGGGGGGGYGGGLGGDANFYGSPGKSNGGNGGKSSWSSEFTGGGRYHVGMHGTSAGGGGGNSGNGGVMNSDNTGGGGGGYGGGVLVIKAEKIEFDKNYPPKFLVSGQKGGTGGSPGKNDGGNGQGGILIISCPSYSADSKHYNLNSQTFGTHETSYSRDNGHGIVTGNPTKVYINGVKY